MIVQRVLRGLGFRRTEDGELVYGHSPVEDATMKAFLLAGVPTAIVMVVVLLVVLVSR